MALLVGAREEEHVGLHALRVEDAGGQAQDGVEVAPVHEAAAQLLAPAVVEEHVVGYDDRRAAAEPQRADAVLDEGELVGGDAVGDGQVVARRRPARRAEGRVGEDEVRALEGRLGAARAERVGEQEVARVDPVEVQVHQHQAVRVGHVLDAAQRLVDLEGRAASSFRSK